MRDKTLTWTRQASLAGMLQAFAIRLNPIKATCAFPTLEKNKWKSARKSLARSLLTPTNVAYFQPAASAIQGIPEIRTAMQKFSNRGQS